MWVNYVAPHTGQPQQDDDPLTTDPDNGKQLKTTVPAPEYDHSFSDEELPTTPGMFEDETSDKTVSKVAWNRWNDDDRALLSESHQQRLESFDRSTTRRTDDRGTARGWAAGQHLCRLHG